MAQAAGLYLFSFPRYRQWNFRNRVKFLIPGPLKICKKSIVYGHENTSVFAQRGEKIRIAHAAGLYLLPFSRYRQWNVRNRVKFLIPGPLKICKKSIVPYGREKIQHYVTGRENENGASRRSVSL